MIIKFRYGNLLGGLSNITELLFTLKITLENLQALIEINATFNDCYLFLVLKQIIEKMSIDYKTEVIFF